MLLSVHDFPPMLSSTLSWLLHSAFFGYFLAALLALLGIFWPRKFRSSTTHFIATISTLLFLAYFILRFATAGITPLTNTFEVLVMIAFGLVAGYLLMLLAKPRWLLSVWVFPCAVLILFAALPLAVYGGPTSVPESKRMAIESSWLLITHIIFAIFATIQFVFAFLASLVYLLQDRALSLKLDSRFFRSLPSLEAITKVVFVSLGIGLPLMTISLVLALIRVREELNRWLSDPLILSSLVMWAVFLLALIGRLAAILHGKRSMYVVQLGFALVVLTFLGAGFFSGSFHSVSQHASQRIEEPANYTSLTSSETFGEWCQKQNL